MALSVIIILYTTIGLMAAAGSIFLSKKLFSARGEQIFFALFLIAIAAFYLAFTAYFGDDAAWRVEAGGVVAFAVLALLALRVPALLISAYFLHGLWDLVHEIHAHAGGGLLFGQPVTEIPLAYGFFCAAYDVCLAFYFYTRLGEWRGSGTSAR